MQTTEQPAPDGSGVFLMQGDKMVGFRAAEEQGETPAPAEEPGLLSQIGQGVADVGHGIVNGVQEGLVETAETIGWAGDELMFKASGAITGTEQNYYPGEGWMTRDEVEAANREDRALGWQPIMAIDKATDVSDPTSMVGGMASGVAQFAAGYGLAGKALKMAKSGAVVKGAVKGAVTDFMAFDAHEDRFSDFLRDNAGLRDPITEFLAADESDTVLEGKLKNTLEGLGMGIAAEGVMRLVKVFKRAKQVQVAQGDEAATEAMNDGLAEMVEKEPELFEQLELFDTLSDPNMRHEGAGKKVVNNGAAASTADRAGDAGGSVGVRDAAERVGEVTDANAKAAGVEHRPGKPVNTEGLNAALQREIGLRRGGSEPDPTRQLEGELFNFDKMDSDVDIKDVMNMAADDIVAHGIKDRTTFDEIVADARGFLSDAVDVSPEIIDGSLARMAQDAHKQQGIVIAGKALVQSLSREVELLAYKIDAGTASELDMEKFIRMERRLVETSANLKSVITGSAQTTAAGRIRTADWIDGSEIATQDLLGSRLSMDGGIEGIKARARAIKLNKETGGAEQGLLRIVETNPATPMRILNEIYINNILSGPKTHMVNFLSNAFQTLLMPGEKVLGGAVRLDWATMREGFRQYTGVALALQDSFRMMKQAFASGRNILDPEAAILEANGVDYHAIKYTGENPVLASVFNGRFGVGNIIRLPSRALLTGDEFFKQLNYRASLFSRLSTEAADLVASGQLTKDAAAKYVTDRMATAFDAKGGARSQVDLDFAREATFTQDLRAGSISKGIQDMTNRHPGLKLIMPFVRTPTNIMKAGLQRTPVLRRLSKTLQADIRSGDPRRMASAQGKLVTGSLVWGGAIMAAMNGNITGSGPKDPALRARLMETGWRPYSFVTTGANGQKVYTEYRRFEPFAMFLGIAADITEIGGQVGEAEMEELAMAGVIAAINNIGSKTYMQGTFDVVEAANDPQRFLPRLVNQYASNMVPYSSALREMRKAGDPTMREVRSITDAVMNTIPGYSDDLPARRSWVTGEPLTYPAGFGPDSLSPIYQSEDKQDPVLTELANMDHAMSAPTRKQQGIELSPAQYSRFLEIHGTIRNGRNNLHQALERLFETKTYRAAAAVDTGPDSEAASMVQSIVQGYRRAAFQQLMREDVTLQASYIQQQQQQAQKQREIYSGLAGLDD